MPEVSNKLIDEMLKDLEQQTSLVREDVRWAREELLAMRGSMAVMQRDIHKIYDCLDRLDRSFDRIERRLELSDTPV